MRIYYYIAKKFWGPFFFALGVFTTLVVLGDTFEKMKNLSNGTTTILDLLSYSLATFPNWLTTIMPVACLSFRKWFPTASGRPAWRAALPRANCLNP